MAKSVKKNTKIWNADLVNKPRTYPAPQVARFVGLSHARILPPRPVRCAFRDDWLAAMSGAQRWRLCRFFALCEPPLLNIHSPHRYPPILPDPPCPVIEPSTDATDTTDTTDTIDTTDIAASLPDHLLARRPVQWIRKDRSKMKDPPRANLL
jgi:hypothetical protein